MPKLSNKQKEENKQKSRDKQYEKLARKRRDKRDFCLSGSKTV